MEAIEISEKEFLVNTIGEVKRAHISGFIVFIDRIETQSTCCYGGGFNENVPVYGFVDQNVWEEHSKNLPVIVLDSRPDLKMLYDTVHNAYEDEYESEADFPYDHIDDFWR